METRHLGRKDVSALGLGCMGMSGSYGARDEAESVATLDRALGLGITFFDTADVYGMGHNEELLGRAFAGRFGQFTLATKCGLVMRDGKLGVDGSPAHITAACERSLKRLGLDVIDLYYLHRPDSTVPIEDSVGAMAALKQAGKIRHIGLSEATADTLRRAAREHPIAALQSEYSLFERGIEAEVMPACRELGIAVVPFSPLGRGLLTGAISSAGDLASQGDFRGRGFPRMEGDNLARNIALVAKVKAIAAAHAASPAQIALAWLLGQGPDIIPIPGSARRVTLEDNAGALSIALTAAERETLSTLAAAVSGERYGATAPTRTAIDTPPRR